MTESPASEPAPHPASGTCRWLRLDHDLLEQALVREGASFGVAGLLASHPNLFSQSAVFVEQATLAAMAAVVAAVERLVALPRYAEDALAVAHPHARLAVPTRGAFLGYDFHLSDSGPQLIEINTNAGGGLLNGVLRRAQRACCAPVAEALGLASGDTHGDTAQRFMTMMCDEYALAHPGALPRRIAVVDDSPASQYLYPEFVLFTRLCESRGLEAIICDASELEIEGDALLHQGRAIDLVYNRLTDFWLAAPEHAVLAEAFRRQLAVVTPHPRAYALYADKRRLIVLSDPAALARLGASEDDIALLARHVPPTFAVSAAERERWWAERKGLFFKPQSGYGGKAAYRGDKLTKGAFEQVLRGEYVAQRLVPASERSFQVGDEQRALKIDIRNFAYAGEVQLVCARLYQGQTTNFRTHGGGFAPVYSTPVRA